MEYVIADVYLPASGKSFDVKFPVNLNVGIAASVAAKSLAGLSEESYLPSGTSCFAWADTGVLLDTNKTLYDAGVKNSSKLLLI